MDFQEKENNRSGRIYTRDNSRDEQVLGRKVEEKLEERGKHKK